MVDRRKTVEDNGVEPELNRTFYGRLKPISDQFIPDALAVSGFTREECLAFDDAKSVMESFQKWLASNCKGRTMFVSDNNGFDWQFINWYFHHFTGKNPFGFSSANLGSLYKGMQKDTFVNFKHLRKTKHTHNPVDDARGNAEALLQMKEMALNSYFEACANSGGKAPVDVAEFLPWNLSPDRLSELQNSTAGKSNVNSS